MQYKIHELLAISIFQFAVERNGEFVLSLSEEQTLQCLRPPIYNLKDDCALFYQTMSVLHGDNIKNHLSGDIIRDLSEIIIYIDFSGVFDATSKTKRSIDQQAQAKAMFSPNGVTLDFGNGQHRYVAFERSASMSRKCRISFIREDFFERVSERIMLGMSIENCQLAKLYAYNGLMLTSGFRIDDMSIWDEKRVVIVGNPVSPVYEVNVITAEDDGSDDAVRKYNRVQEKTDIEVLEFDGEGLISKEYSGKIDKAFCGEHIHTSFQIRMPYIKGVVHEVDFKEMFAELDVPIIVDIWGDKHNIEDVDLILTESMFKGLAWIKENNLAFAQFLERCKDYNHALYISGVSEAEPQQFCELNYQFLNTADMTSDEFRPLELPFGWEQSPENIKRNWITKYTEILYYNLVADEEYRRGNFHGRLGNILAKNPLFINEPIYTKELENKAESVLKNYAIGRLITLGDNRYLSGDLMRFIQKLVKSVADIDDEYMGVVIRLEYECDKNTVFYAPGAAYPENEKYTLLRNPHIARNEEAIVSPPHFIGPLRQKYLSHLNYVVMVDSRTLIPERLGGADFDGDMVKTIADPLLNECISRNYKPNDYDTYSHQTTIPLIKIPSATAIIGNYSDWQARYETIKNTFSNRVGQISNAAFNRSIIAYDENSGDDEREALQEETEMLEILAGLEIDSAKSGVKPDLSDFLGNKSVERSIYLKYKDIVNDNKRPKYYAKSQNKKLKSYFNSIDWETVSANVERLPYLAKMLKENTPRIKAKPAKDEELFIFAQDKNWKENINPKTLEDMKNLIADYNDAIDRVRQNFYIPTGERKRRGDIERILFRRGQENDFTSDELYRIFSVFPSWRFKGIRQWFLEQNWQLLSMEDRRKFLNYCLPVDTPQIYHDLFADFRFNGYRILGDIVCDIDDAIAAQDSKKYQLTKKDDSEQLRHFIGYYKSDMGLTEFKQTLSTHCRRHIAHHFGTDTALKCAVALGKRNFAFEILLDIVEKYALEVRGI